MASRSPSQQLLIHPADSSLSESLEEKAIRPSPSKPYEIAESPASTPLIPCAYCARSFSQINLARHVVICQKLAEKPKRVTFNAIAQRLAHVAQEATVQPVIQRVLQEKCPSSSKPTKKLQSPRLIMDPTKKEAKSSKSKKQSPSRLGHTGTELFNQTQKGLLKCPSCERCFQEKTYERHVDFCKQQQAAKERQLIKEDTVARTDLLLRRVKYRPPVLKLSKKSVGIPIRKTVSSMCESDFPRVKPLQQSKSSMAAFNSNIVERQEMYPSAISSRKKTPENRIHPAVKTPTQSSSAESRFAPKPAVVTNHKEKQQSPPILSSRTILNSAGDSLKPPKDNSKRFPLPSHAFMDSCSKPELNHRDRKSADAPKHFLPEINSPTDPLVSPAITRVSVDAVDKLRLFQRIGGSYKSRNVENPILLSDIIAFSNRSNSLLQDDNRSIFSLQKTSESPEVEKLDSLISGSATYRSDYHLDDESCQYCKKMMPIPEADYCCYCGMPRTQQGSWIHNENYFSLQRTKSQEL